MVAIKLTQGKVALVDDADAADLLKYNWQARRDGPRWYASRGDYDPKTRKTKTVRMHHQITGGKSDHRDGDGLNNQRGNLRPCTDQQNTRNAIKRSGSSKYKGVHSHCGKWQARITVGGKTRSLGHFGSEVEAALAYNSAAKKLFGEFARLNEPERIAA